jgi:TRAP-type mannitol/chloroaromatic compound transport system permease small subunit
MLETMRRIARLSTWIGGAALIACAVLIAIEVVARKFFNISLGGVDEITSYVFAIGVAWSLAYTLLSRAHIRIDIVYTRLPRNWRSALDFLAMASLVLVVGMLLWQAAATALTSYEIGARSNTPLGVTLWVPQFLWVSGLAFFLLTALVLSTVALLAIRRGDFRHASEIVGIRTIDEEIRDET